MRRCLLPLSSHLLHYFCCCVGGDGASGGFWDFTEAGSFSTSPSHRPHFVIILIQGFHVRGFGVIVLCGGSGCGGKWGTFEGGLGLSFSLKAAADSNPVHNAARSAALVFIP